MQRVTRTLLACTVAMMLAAAVSSETLAATSSEWRFTVYLDDEEIGHHHFRLTRTPRGERLRSEARFKVRFLMVPIYRYTHDASELWEDRCLRRIEASTYDNGKRLSLTGEAEDADFTVIAGSQRERLSGCVMSFAYWDTRILKAHRLLNPQTGEYLEVEITPLGLERIASGQGSVGALRYRIQGEDLLIDLWYSEDGDWLALQSAVESGRVIRYERQ